MSKTLFVLGVERGMALIESQPGVDAIVVDAKGQLHYSTGLRDHSGAAEKNRRQVTVIDR
jgi:thiamine biosynthesis lipoprotein